MEELGRTGSTHIKAVDCNQFKRGFFIEYLFLAGKAVEYGQRLLLEIW